MRIKTLLLLLVAAGMAVGTAMLARNWLEGQRNALMAQNRAVDKKPVRQVLVAKADLAIGTLLRPDMLHWQAWPDASLPPNYAVAGERKAEDFTGALVRFPISAGEPVTDAKVVTPGNAGFLAAVLPAGARAVSVPVTVTTGISGFIFPGDRVDLILTHIIPQDSTQAQGERRASETVLRDIRVLAIDQKVEGKPGEPVVARTATLEVTPKQSEVIAITQEMGHLSLSLRSLARDESPALPATPTLDNDVSRLLPARGVKREEKKEVTVLRGGKSNAAPAAAQVALK